MTLTDSLIAELKREARTTRRVLERVPAEHMAWRPHEKSMSLGQLALHVAQLPHAITDLADAVDSEVPNVPLKQAETVDELLHTFDEAVPYAVEKLAGWGDDGLRVEWRMRANGSVLLTMPRVAVIRNILLNHTYHHRGQLTVYLRLLGVPLPPVYGPTADEAAFG